MEEATELVWDYKYLYVDASECGVFNTVEVLVPFRGKIGTSISTIKAQVCLSTKHEHTRHNSNDTYLMYLTYLSLLVY